MDRSARKYVAENYPEALPAYDAFPYDIQRADFARYLILHGCGGVYTDLDMECLRPVSPLLAERTFVACLEPEKHARAQGVGKMVCSLHGVGAPTSVFDTCHWEPDRIPARRPLSGRCAEEHGAADADPACGRARERNRHERVVNAIRGMHRITNPKLEILEAAVELLDELIDQLVFLGGCATGLLLTDIAAPPIRAIQDVDVITEVAIMTEYYRLAERLRAGGFQEDSNGNAPICRWKAGGLLLDVMPTNPQLLGFGSEWYRDAFETATLQTLPSGKGIRMITGRHASWQPSEAVVKVNYQMSHDMEDIVAVLDGRPEVVEEIDQARITLRRHLAESFRELFESHQFREALYSLHRSNTATLSTRWRFRMAAFPLGLLSPLEYVQLKYRETPIPVEPAQLFLRLIGRKSSGQAVYNIRKSFLVLSGNDF